MENLMPNDTFVQDYRLIIHMQPNYHDNPQRPYFWCILKNGQVNYGSGWSCSIQQAFIDGNQYVDKLKKESEYL